MKTYPSIPRSTGQSFQEYDAYVFDKLDGSNLRFEWSRKKGWVKYGTRRRLFDTTDPVFGEAITLFHEVWADVLTKTFRDIGSFRGIDRFTVYCEFWGDNSLAGLHESTDQKKLTLFDVCAQRKGFFSPKDFLKLFGAFEHVPKFLGYRRWTRSFVDSVRNGELEGVTFEGVVGKAGDGHKLIRSKAKTQAWIDAVLAQHGEEQGRKLVES